MSIEEARLALFADIAACVSRPDEAYIKSTIDRLILEVRAEMDCSGVVWDGIRQDWTGDTCLEQPADAPITLCPSCSARAELAKVAV